MASDAKALRIEGIYQQNKNGDLMMRVKLASGLLSVSQAAALAQLSSLYGTGILHLTTRGSLEFHSLREENLPMVQRGMATVGLFSRGACGGAVRGISCSTGFGEGFAFSQKLARKLLLYFSGNPYFEGLPKKFKIAVEADYAGSRHLIQDLAFVYVGLDGEQPLYDVWTAGGLGRAPQAGILYRKSVHEADILNLAEAIIRVYAANVAPPKRLKSLIAGQGEERFRQLVADDLAEARSVSFSDAYDKTLLPHSADAAKLKLTVPVFAGELAAEKLKAMADAAGNAGIEYFLITADQDIALLPKDRQQRRKLIDVLESAGFTGLGQPHKVLRVCPGNHECSMGLAATRDLAREIDDRYGDKLEKRSLAISGCPNSCAQPQLSAVGIIASKSIKNEEGDRTPRYDFYRRQGEGLGECLVKHLSEDQLFELLDDQL